MWIQPIDQLRISIRKLHSIKQLTNCKNISLSYINIWFNFKPPIYCIRRPQLYHTNSTKHTCLRVAESQVRIPAPSKYCKAASAAAAVSAATASTAASAAAEATEASSEAEEAVKNKNKGA